MQRYTISLEDSLANEFEEWISRHKYENRSEAIRDLLRERFGQEALSGAEVQADCVACVSYVYDHHQRELGRRLAQEQHSHHDLTVSTLHVHLDVDQCLEVALLRGEPTRVRDQAERLIAGRGVRHGKIHVVPVGGAKTYTPEHGHAHDHPHHHHEAVKRPARKKR